MSVEKKYYLIKEGTAYFNDYIVEVDGTEFQGKHLKVVELGEKTTRICSEAFANNDLKSIVFHKKIKFIEERAFYNNQIETLIFERREIPIIEYDAFSKNPIKTIIVPYATINEYKVLFKTLDLPKDVQIISNLESRFNTVMREKKEDEVIYLETSTIYGVMYWKVVKGTILDLQQRLAKDGNEDNFSLITISEGKTCWMHTDARFDLILYQLDGTSMTFDDFEKLYYDKDACNANLPKV